MTPTSHLSFGRLLLGLALGAALPVQAADTTLTGDWGRPAP